MYNILSLHTIRPLPAFEVLLTPVLVAVLSSHSPPASWSAQLRCVDTFLLQAPDWPV